MTRLSASEARKLGLETKRHKYGAKAVELDGIRFASKAEAAYYAALKLRERAGEVTAVEMQRPFALIGPDGALLTTYRADFAFWDNHAGKFRVVDVKGVETPAFRLKRKLMRSLLGIEVEVAK